MLHIYILSKTTLAFLKYPDGVLSDFTLQCGRATQNYGLMNMQAALYGAIAVGAAGSGVDRSSRCREWKKLQETAIVTGACKGTCC